MRVGKRLVYKNTSKTCQFFCKRLVITLLARVKAQILVHFERHLRKLAHPFFYRGEFERLYNLAVGAAEMRD